MMPKIQVFCNGTPFTHSFIPLACAEYDDSLLFSGASSIPLCYVLFPATLLHQLFVHPLSPHLAIYFLVCLSIFCSQIHIYNTLLGILFSSNLSTCPNQGNLFNVIVSIIIGFLTLAIAFCVNGTPCRYANSCQHFSGSLWLHLMGQADQEQQQQSK